MTDMTDDTVDSITRDEAPKPARGTWVLAIVGLLIVALLVAILAVLLTRGGQPASEATDEGTFTVAGTMELISSDADGTKSACYGTGGFDDLGVGTQVVIRNAAGETVGIGELAGGEVPRRYRFGSMIIACAWHFEVPDVPSGSASYSVEVSHRGEIAFTEDEASSLALSLS